MTSKPTRRARALWRRFRRPLFILVVLVLVVGLRPSAVQSGGSDLDIQFAPASPIWVTEGGAYDSYQVKLHKSGGNPPTADIDVKVEPDSRVEVSSDHVTWYGTTTSPDHFHLTFTPTDYNVFQTVYVRAYDDNSVESPHPEGEITHTGSSSDPYFNGKDKDLTIHVNDNDLIRVNRTVGDPGLEEGGSADQYGVKLAIAPEIHSGVHRQVDVRMWCDDQVEISSTGAPGSYHTYSDSSPLVFTYGSSHDLWDTPQTLYVRAVDDAIVEGPHSGRVTFHTHSDDGTYSNKTQYLPLEIADNDEGTIVITETGEAPDTLVAEGGTTDTYTIVLGYEPCGNVTVTATPNPSGSDAQVYIRKGTSGSWTTGSITITFDGSSGHHWHNPQTVSVKAVDDLLVEGDHDGIVNHSATGGGYDGVTAKLTAHITDNDADGAAVELDCDGPGEGPAVAEQGETTDTYLVRLTMEPAGEVTVALTADEQVLVSSDGETFGGTAELSFGGESGNDYDEWQTITVKAVDDSVVEGSPHFGHVSNVASGSGYSDSETMTVGITDDDEGSLVITLPEGGLSVDETDRTSAIYHVRLGARPSGNVTVSLTTDPSDQVTVDPATLYFGPATLLLDFRTGTLGPAYEPWNEDQDVTVTAVDDAILEGSPHSCVITHTASGDGYGGVEDEAAVDITDNESPLVVVTESDGETQVAEDGSTDTYTVALGCQPDGDVDVTVTPDEHVQVRKSESDDWSDDPITLDFTSEDYDARTVYVRAIADDLVEGDHNGTITNVASGDGFGSSFAGPSVTAHITDDDADGAHVDIDYPGEGEGPWVFEEGETDDTFRVALSASPAGTVTVTFSNSDGQVTFSPDHHDFTSEDFDGEGCAWKTVTVTAVDDALVEGTPHSGAVHFAASGSGYSDSGDVTVAITDNDESGVIVEPTEVCVSENGGEGTYQVRLGSEPTAAVEISINPDGQTTADPETLWFYPGSDEEPDGLGILTTDGSHWDEWQTVTVGAVEDDMVEGTHTGTITHSATSEDDNYDDIPIRDVTAHIEDNDSAGVVVEPTTVNVAEGGATDTYEVYLASEPTGTVTITIHPDSQVTVDPSTLYFFPGSDEITALGVEGTDWNEPQNVRVTAVDDSVVEGPHHGHITHSASGGGFDGVEIAGVLANVTDNDREAPPHKEKACCSPPGLSGPFITLVDMDGHWVEDVASLIVRLRVMSALPGNRFNPDGLVTRAEFVRMMARTMGCPAANVRVPFNDVQRTDSFYADLMREIKSGVVRASDGPAFRPNAPITREEAAVMIARVLIHCGRPEVVSDLLARQILARFRDARQIGDDNLRTVALAVYTEMMIGRAPGTFMPNASLSRAEVAQALARLWRSLRAH